jgi:hypothetical protein
VWDPQSAGAPWVSVTDRYLRLSMGGGSGRLLLVFTLPVVRRVLSGGERTTPSSDGRGHRHRFRWVGDDAFSGSSLYACRCGVVRPAL